MKSNIKIQAFALLVLAAAMPASAAAETIRIIVPYIGSITNKYSNSAYQLDLKDTGEMDGIYAQWINTEKFQVNGFYYSAPNINYSDVTGMHLNFDYYLKPTKAGKWVAGAGLEDINIDMSAGRHIAGLKSFDMDNDVVFYFLRAGRYFYYENGLLSSSLLPYAGYAHEKITGEINMERLYGPMPRASTVNIGESDNHPLAGLNLNATFAHFLDLQAKWMGRFKDGETLNDYSLMANIYLNKHWGLSYRYKYMEYGSSSNSFNLAGVAYCF
ncbi:MAG: hypothetical protein A2X34_09540 [Elusimicrobia bacterium GWC2_51_8]|nr:MAG: hypothetical protein A2X34_09540 [Elusimicrobia bacterium GWC2_51_8]OGR86549.1 MAG: hypothetical protein A2021_08850 [Elusimicrobia bacterium GWF2_52_66]HAF95051.1 hypothetical protein [Elusimicrobiota bacterium]HCE98712.1 hypothetical protein [Elusimicrobiota bacterium]